MTRAWPVVHRRVRRGFYRTKWHGKHCKGGQKRGDMNGGTWRWVVKNDRDGGRPCGGGAVGRTARGAGGAIAGGRGTWVCGVGARLLT